MNEIRVDTVCYSCNGNQIQRKVNSNILAVGALRNECLAFYRYLLCIKHSSICESGFNVGLVLVVKMVVVTMLAVRKVYLKRQPGPSVFVSLLHRPRDSLAFILVLVDLEESFCMSIYCMRNVILSLLKMR